MRYVGKTGKNAGGSDVLRRKDIAGYLVLSAGVL